MVSIFYASLVAVSLICSGVYFYIWHKHFDVNITLIFTIIPIACIGELLYSLSENINEAVIAIKVIYLGGSFLQLFILMSILNLCQIEIRRWFRVLLYAICVVIYGSALTIGFSDMFYKSLSFDIISGVSVLSREYGWMHTAFYAVVVVYFAAGLSVIIYSLRKKRQIPRTIISLLLIPDIICVLSYFIGKKLISHVDLVPLGYVMAQIVYIFIANRMNLYNVSDTAIDSMVQEQSIGYISFDFRYRYLGSNETARLVVPDLDKLAVDDVFGYKPSERRVRHYLNSFERDPEKNEFVYRLHSTDGKEENDRIYNVSVNYLYEGSRKRGYIVTFKDDTANRKYIQLLDSYNENLQQEVEAKTKSIIEMHDNLIMSLAMMVESRDNSTGGHIRRTSEGVRILTDELRREEGRSLSEDFCRDVIKAAPMHDLGKIAVDDAVLRKPGRFTDEEFEKMKHHAAEGARVIHEILLHTNDNSFKAVAENVAHYHHERWDGSGYPEGLSGEQIPFEARIMAIADVYDALVSKRVYKDAYSFEKADAIILEGMGTQFDPGLKEAYINARPRLEEYYRKEAERAEAAGA
ncbi:MAG: HD domain-containing protein [Lachnospiraceae bacterium]|nr:HD domain-containing protein [Lachnospiraceae bacterium]